MTSKYPRRHQVDSQCPGLAGDGWPEDDLDQERDLIAQVGRHSGRKPGDTFSIIDDCIDLERELAASKPRKVKA